MPSPALAAVPDDASTDWRAELAAVGPARDLAIARLHAFLMRAAHAEARRRAVSLGVVGPELDDIAAQAAADAVVSILRRLDTFRGEARFTTWAYKFVVFEVAGKVNRHHWQRRTVVLDDDRWAQLPSRLGMAPEESAEWRELVLSLRRAVTEELSDRQRSVFTALVLEGRPLDELVADTGSSRGAVYKTMFDARRKLRAALVTDGHIRDNTSTHQSTRRSRPRGEQMTGWHALDQLLATDPIDGGCDTGRELLDMYAERLRDDGDAARLRFPQVAAHIRACGPCAEDLEGLLHALAAHD
ncbi:RNA polymerase sigma factor [uncultured Jatrophihabitans sp.]|uniref:RNA polymerase sigma factor n=1 Tax=uncultured Jatrophihabitans sp. TaxID=1610747 RepID=UPI0035CAB172